MRLRPVFQKPVPLISAVRSLKPAGGIHFSSLDQKQSPYPDIDPEQVMVVSSGSVHVEKNELKQLLNGLIQAQTLAWKNRMMGLSESLDSYGSYVLLNDGKTYGLGANHEASRDDTFCSERSAFISARNHALVKAPLATFESPNGRQLIQNKLQVKAIGLTDWQPFGHYHGTPCGECLAWMLNQSFFSPKTTVATLDRTNQPEKPWALKLRTLEEIVPLWGKTQPSLTHRSINSLVVRYSAQALKEMKGYPRLEPNQIQGAIHAAFEAYSGNAHSRLPEKNYAASVLFSDGQLIAKPRFDLKRRWPHRPEITAIADGLSGRKGKRAVTKLVKLVAFYGQDSECPNLKTVAYLAKLQGEQPKEAPPILIAVIENDQIKIRSVNDYITDHYVSTRYFDVQAKRVGTPSS